MAYNGRALSATGIGILFIWSGIKGWSVLATIGDLITGHKPAEAVAYPLTIAGSSAANALGQVADGTAAAIATQYVGHAYHFGGAPGKSGQNPWDCSSFVNFVVGIKMGRAIPGFGPGKYNGSVHGPPTGVWAAWNGMDYIKRADVRAGDILVWGAHMGIATSNTQYVSAHSPKIGTTVTAIPARGLGPLVRIGRLR